MRLPALAKAKAKAQAFGWPWQEDPAWGGIPADRHGQAGALSFADGHAQTKKWRWPKRDRNYGDRVRNKSDGEDFKFMTFGRPRERDYTASWWNSLPNP